MSGKIVRKTRNIEKLIKKIQTIAKSNVESGYFSEQGDHPTADMSYVELATIHAKGEGNFPVRDVRLPTTFKMKEGQFKGLINKELKSYFYKDTKVERTLDHLGENVTNLAKSFFGVPSPFMPMNSTWWADIKGENTPLVFEGHLMDAWTHKINKG